MKHPSIEGMTRSERLQQAWLAQKQTEEAIDQFVKLLEGRNLSSDVRAKWREVQVKASSFRDWIHLADFYSQ